MTGEKKGENNLIFLLPVICFVILLFYPSVCLGEKIEWEPWEALKSQKKVKKVGYETSLPKIIFLKSYKVFSKYISPLDGSRCAFRPTCARYSFEAIQKYGAFKGIVMAAERVMRCHGYFREKDYPLAPSGHFYDPVEGNDVW